MIYALTGSDGVSSADRAVACLPRVCCRAQRRHSYDLGVLFGIADISESVGSVLRLGMAGWDAVPMHNGPHPDSALLAYAK